MNFAMSQLMPSKDEIEPPWVKFPGHPPGDVFWRISGDLWFNHVWEPYWTSLNLSEQSKYLDKWNVPKVWQDFYFDADFQEWLDSVDDDL